MSRGVRELALVAAAVAACDRAPTTEAQDGAYADASAPAVREAAPPDAAVPPVAKAAPPAPAAEAAPPEEPIEFRIPLRAMMIYGQPRFDAPFRGKLARREPFALFERVDGDIEHCEGEGWGRVGPSAFACLEHTQTTESKPDPLPRLARGQLTPYYYARLRKGDDVEPAPVWKHRKALREGEEPIDALEKEHDYAFTHRRRTRQGVLLTDRFFRVVKEKDVRRLKPSEYAGRELEAKPIPEGASLAWSVMWRYATFLEEPKEEAKALGRLAFQAEFYVKNEPTRRRGVDFYPRFDGEPGWLSGKEIRVLVPMAAPSGIADDEPWIDVDLEQQTLAVYQGETMEFATLISSGSHKHPTPPGVYRIVSKQVTGDMRSRQTDDEPYYVEAVPWVQYFDGRYALHGTFWHNRFGRRTSHGCINLSAQDARRVYELTTPYVRPGWVMAYEHEVEHGTVVRIRKGSTEPEDKRGDVLTRYAKR